MKITEVAQPFGPIWCSLWPFGTAYDHLVSIDNNLKYHYQQKAVRLHNNKFIYDPFNIFFRKSKSLPNRITKVDWKGKKD
jgi:hypothetical protein